MRRMSLLSLLGLLAALILAPVAAAQSTPGATPPAATPEAVVSAALAPLGAGAHVAVFSRATLDPGKTLALGATAGPALAFVASGSAILTAQTAGARVVTAAASNVVAPGASAALDVGALLLLDTGATVNLTNDGGTAVQLLNAVFLPAPSNSTTPSANPSFTDPVALPTSAIQIVVTHVTLAAGATTTDQATGAPALVAAQAGAVTLTLNPGRLRVLRADGSVEFVAGPAVDPAAVPTLNANDPEDREVIEEQGGDTTRRVHGAQIGIGAGDAGLVEPGGNWTATNDGSVPASAFAITLAPAPVATPAV